MDGAKVGTYAACGLRAGAGWMDGWMFGHGAAGMHANPPFPAVNVLLSLSGLALTTFVSSESVDLPVSQQMPLPPPRFLNQIPVSCLVIYMYTYCVIVGTVHLSVLVQIIRV